MTFRACVRLLVATVLIASSCAGSAGAPPGEQVATDTRTETAQPGSGATNAGEPSTDAEPAGSEASEDAGNDESAVASGRPASPPDGFPFDCTPESAQLITIVSFGDERSIGLGDNGEVLWESSQVTGAMPRHWVNPQTNEYYVDTERLIDLTDGTVVEEFEGTFRTDPAADCSIPYDGIGDTPNHLVAPNGHIIWQAPANTGATEDWTPSAVIYSESGGRDVKIGVSVQDGTPLWSAPYETLRIAPGSDVATRQDGDDNEFIDARTGEVLWRLPSKGSTTNFIFCGEVVWVIWSNGVLRDIEVRTAATGEILRTYENVDWEAYTRGGQVNRAATGMIVYSDSTLTIEHDCENPTGEVALDLEMVSFTAEVNDVALVVAASGIVRFIDPMTGEILHSREMTTFSPPLATESTFLLRETEDTMIVVDARTGDVIDEYADVAAVYTVLAPPHLDEPIVEVFLQGGQGLQGDLNSVTGELIGE